MYTSMGGLDLKSAEGLSAEQLLLHREPMLLVDHLVSITEESAECSFRIEPGNAFLVDGKGVPAYVGLEYMAQCIAVHAGARARVEGKSPPLGFLLGTRQLETSTDFLEQGVEYLAVCRQLLKSADGMGSFECEISLDGKPVVTARIAVLERHDGWKIEYQ